MDYFKVYSASVPYDYKKWLQFWESTPEQELVAHPEYVKLFASKSDSSLCAIFNSDDGLIMFPLILRSINAEKWAQDINQIFDITGPYGYAGPFCWGKPDYKIFWKEFDRWANQNNVVSLFVRFSLFPEQLVPFNREVKVNSKHIVLDLDSNIEQIWMNYKHKVRNKFKRSSKFGLDIQIDFEGKCLKNFIEVYYETLNRRNAADRYYFKESFFLHLVNQLKGHFIFFNVLRNDMILASNLVLKSRNFLYSFLGGTVLEGLKYGATDFLKHNIIKWGVENKYKAFILGGGYVEDDGIYQFKKAFAPEGIKPCIIGTWVYDPATYKDLINIRKRWERAEHNNDWSPNKGFFPLYRS